jgi:hypothetical protein
MELKIQRKNPGSALRKSGFILLLTHYSNLVVSEETSKQIPMFSSFLWHSFSSFSLFSTLSLFVRSCNQQVPPALSERKSLFAASWSVCVCVCVRAH